MEMKCRKIRGIDKSICTAEQKIAYNYAFMWVSAGKTILKMYGSELAKSEGFHDIENLVLKDLLRNPDMAKYNHDAIIVAFRQGFRNYCENWFIATDYERIGKVFHIPYKVV